MTIRRGYLITSARHTCLAGILFSLLASTAAGQDEPDLRIATLTSQLKQGDSFVRWRAAKALVRIGSYSKAEVPALIEALMIEEGDIGERAREALVKIGPDAVPALIKALEDRGTHWMAIGALAAIGPPAVPALIEALKHHEEDVRLGALEAFREMNLQGVTPRPTTLLPILIEALKDPNPAIRRAAVQNISCTGAEATPGYLALIEALKDQDPEVRSAADSALCCVRLAPGHPVVQTALALVLETLKNPDASVRSGAAQVLAYLGSTAKPALYALINASKDPEVKVRSSAARALGTIEPAADAVVTALIDALRDSDKTVRSSAASALKSAPTIVAIPALIEALKDRDVSVRRNAADSLAKPDARDAVPSLIQLLSDQDKDVRNAAIDALRAIGAGAAQPLVEALKHRDGKIRLGAALILRDPKLDPKAALAAQIEALKDEDASVRSSAASSFGGFWQGPEDKTVSAALVEALKDGDAEVRSSAARSLRRFMHDETVIPALVEALKDPNNSVRYSAAWSLNSVNAEPKAVIPILIAALKDQDPAVRSAAADALGRIGPNAKGAVPALLELLEDRSLDVCKSAIGALGNLGGDEPAVVPALIKLLKHWDRGIRDAATQALVSIGALAAPPLVRLLMGQDSALRVKSYYALMSIGDVFALIATLKSRDKEVRSLVLETIEDIRADPARSMQAPDLLFDPSRKYLFQTVRIPCTYEGDGRAIFVSELDTGTSFPILASSGGLGGPSVFIESGGRYYLVIDEGGGEADCSTGSFWLYDFKANEFVIHAEGGIGETERGVFPLIYCEGDKATRVGTVTMKNLLNRERPLRLLPRPMHGLTLRKNTKAFDTCNQIVIIRNAGTRVLLTGKREDGSYEIYYKGAIATVPKGSLKTTK